MRGNSSEETKFYHSQEEFTFLLVFTLFEIVIGSVSNFLVMITILKAKKLRNRSEDRLILNLALADFFSLTTFLPWHAYAVYHGKIHYHSIYESVNTLTIFYAGNSILAVAGDRFIAVAFPLRHRTLMTGRTTLTISIATFAVATAVASGDLVRPRFKLLNSFDTLLSSYFLSQHLAMAFLYLTICFYTLKQSRAVVKQRRSIGANCENSSRIYMKILLKIFLQLFSYYVTSLPILMYVMYTSVVMEKPVSSQATARSWLYSILCLNSCLNPFVYAFRTKRFKTAFSQKLLPKGWNVLVCCSSSIKR